MKFMHLSDLHIGKRVNEFSMLEDQTYILQQILQIAIREQVEGILIAGDVYDKTVPSAEAVHLFDDFLTELAKQKLPVFVISGNHDSPERIAFGSRLMGQSGVHLSPVYQGQVEPLVLQDKYGEIHIYLLPFLKPATVKHVFGDAKIDSYQDAVKLAVDMIVRPEETWKQMQETAAQEDLLEGEEAEPGNTSQSVEVGPKDTVQEVEPEDTENIEHAKGTESAKSAESTESATESRAAYDVWLAHQSQFLPWDPYCRNILIAHQFVAGSERCESEELSVGGIDQVDPSVFADFDYTALGHIHKPQRAGGERIRYSGTPLKYSFSEISHEKSVTIVELREKGNVSISQIPLLPLHDLREIRGTYMELTALDYYQGTNVQDYLRVILTDEEDVPDALGKLRSIYPNIMRLEYSNLRTSRRQQIEGAFEIEQKTPLELIKEFYLLQNNQEMQAEQMDYAAGLIEKIFHQ